MDNIMDNTSCFNDTSCVICRGELGDERSKWCRVTTGLQALIDASISRNDGALTEYLLSKPSEVNVHKDCRRPFACKRRLEQLVNRSERNDSPSADCGKKLRSSSTPFDWKSDCFFCSCFCYIDERHPNRGDNLRFHRCETLVFRQRIEIYCKEERANDEWAVDVKCRLETCIDLPHAEARYHRRCYTAFFDNRSQPGTSGKSAGRPVDQLKN